MRLKVKRGVEPASFTLIAAVVNAALDLKLPHDVVITSGEDGKHQIKSKHYSGEAIDVRSKNFAPATKQPFLELVAARLGPGHDCLLEAVGAANEHFHIEKDGGT
jgi:hypothetical protein